MRRGECSAIVNAPGVPCSAASAPCRFSRGNVLLNLSLGRAHISRFKKRNREKGLLNFVRKLEPGTPNPCRYFRDEVTRLPLKQESPVDRHTTLTPSLQCYLAEILVLESDRGQARQSDIAERMHVHKSSVTGALKKLAHAGLAVYQPYGRIELTPAGRRIAEAVLHRRKVIADYLDLILGIPEDYALQAASDMESRVPGFVIDRLADRLRRLE